MPTRRKKKRRYHLTAAGRSALQTSALKNCPWLHSTGPKTFEGKLMSRQNNLRHGYYTQVSLPEAKQFKAFQRSMQRAGRQGAAGSDPGPPLIEP